MEGEGFLKPFQSCARPTLSGKILTSPWLVPGEMLGETAQRCSLGTSLLQRPLALSVVSQMKDPTFATFMYMLPCGKQSAFFSSQGQEYTVVFWDGKEESR